MTGTRVGLLAGAAALTLTGVGHGRPAVEGTTQDETRIAALEAQCINKRLQCGAWLPESESAVNRATVIPVEVVAGTLPCQPFRAVVVEDDDGDVVDDRGLEGRVECRRQPGRPLRAAR